MLFFFSFLPVEVICQLPRNMCTWLYCWLVKGIRTSSFPAICCYTASTVVHSAKASQSRANCCGNLQLSLFAIPCDYRAVQEMMVKVNCKLMGIDITRSSYGRCTPYSRFRVSKPRKKRNPIFKKLLCSFIYFLPSLD